MTSLLEKAVEATRALPPDAQDEIARLMLRLARPEEDDLCLDLTVCEQRAIEHSKRAAARGAFASDDAVRAAWSRHGL